jgi:hypothetical protein
LEKNGLQWPISATAKINIELLEQFACPGKFRDNVPNFFRTVKPLFHATQLPISSILKLFLNYTGLSDTIL